MLVAPRPFRRRLAPITGRGLLVLASLVVVVAPACGGPSEGTGPSRPTRSGPALDERGPLPTRWSSPGPWDPATLAADASGAVAVGSIGEVRAYDPDGALRWTRVLLEPAARHEPALGPDLVVVSVGRRVVALDRSDGTPRHLWELPGRAAVALGRGVDGVETVVALVETGHLGAWRADTGTPRWGYADPSASGMVAELDVVDGVVYATGRLGARADVTAVDLATGRVLWQAPISPTSTGPVIRDGLALIVETTSPRPTSAARVRALDARSGEERWSVATRGRFLPNAQVAADAAVLVAIDDGGAARLLDLRRREWRWRTRVTAPGVELAQVVLAGPEVLVAADGVGVLRLDRRSGRIVGRDGPGEGSGRGRSGAAGGVVRSIVAAPDGCYELVSHGVAGVLRARSTTAPASGPAAVPETRERGAAARRRRARSSEGRAVGAPDTLPPDSGRISDPGSHTLAS